MIIRIVEAGGAREVTLPAAGTFSVGRSAGNDLVIGDMSVSRQHALFRIEDGRTMLENFSNKGTKLNDDEIVGPAEVGAGDVVEMGDVRLEIRSDEDGKNAADEKEMLKAKVALQQRIHKIILARLNAGAAVQDLTADHELAERAEKCLDDVLYELQHEIPNGVQFDAFRQEMLDNLLDLGPIAPLLRDPEVTEIMVNSYVDEHDPERKQRNRIFVEKHGLLSKTDACFLDEAHLVQVIKRIVEPIGRHVDESSPMVDARLKDGSRVNAIIPPLALDGASLTIRKFAEKKLTTDDLIGFKSLTRPMAVFLEEAVKNRQNILVSGGTGSGKTTLLNILSQFIPEGERIVTIEDSAELKLSHRNIVRLEARPANIEGKGRIAIRDLVINALRMRPDRIIVGECRGAEALDMLQAMNTGHDGSLTTAHANSPRDALSRLENMVMMAGYELPSTAIREQVANALNLIVHQQRLPDGTRKIVKIAEVTGREGDVIQMQDIFEFKQTGYSADGKVEGYYTATGNIPYFVDELRRRGIPFSMDIFAVTA